jgi:hypothetical protein
MTKKLIYEEVKSFIEIESNSGCKLLTTREKYKTTKENLLIKCKCGNEFEVSFMRFKGKNKKQCNDCSKILVNINRKFSYDEVKKYIDDLGYELLNNEYQDIRSRITVKDKEGYYYTPSLNNLIRYKSSSKFHKTNPYTLQNIKLWCKLNNKPFKLMSEQWERNSKNLKWKCLKDNCGEIFEASWNNIQSGKGCSFCSGHQVCLSNCLATKNPELISEWHSVKNGELTPYDVTCGCNKDIWWQCERGHEWPAIICNRSNGKNCPKCSDSNANNKLINFCIINNLIYLPEYRTNKCKDKHPLPFDMAIFYKENIYLIEADGQQHFRPVNFGGISNERALENFKIIQYHDEIKNKYCKNNNISLLRIPYWDFKNIEDILDNYLNDKIIDKVIYN